MRSTTKALTGNLLALALLCPPAAYGAETFAGNCSSNDPSCAQQPVKPAEGDGAGRGGTYSQPANLLSVDKKAPPPTSGQAAASYASTVNKATGAKYDSQGHLQSTHTQMSALGSGSSRSVGTMDLAEAILIMPFNPRRAGKLLFSGKRAHEAAKVLDAVAAKAHQNNNLMQGTPNLAGTNGAHGTGNAAPAAGQPGSTGSSNPAAEARAGALYGELEDKYGVGRDEFEAEATRVGGDPEAMGSFMQELTGDKAVGKDAVNSALDAYAAELGIARGDLYKHSAAPEFSVSEAQPGKPSAPAMPATPAPVADSEAERKLSAAKVKEKKESIRDKLKRALAERRDGRPSDEALSAETLLPIQDQFFEKIKAEHDQELSLFDVIRAKYAEKRQMLERAPGAQ